MASNEGSPSPVMPSNKNPSPEKRKGISRKKKSASQTEVLEKAYVVEKYPCESTRTRLCRDLELTEKQLQIWFTHRRYKDRRDGIDDEELISKARGGSKLHEAASRKRGEIDLNSREAEDNNNNNNTTTFEDHGHPSRVLAEEHKDEEFMGEDEDEDQEEEKEVKVKARPGRKPKVVDAMERAAIAAIERQLGGRLRDDGPPLGFEFDPLPPAAFQHTTCPEGGYREGESEISDRDGRQGNGEFQWRNGAMKRKRKVG